MNLDPAKLLVILVVALIVLGPDRLPQVARQMAAIWKELTRIRDQVTDEVRAAMPDVDLPHIPRIPSPSGAITGFLNNLIATPTGSVTDGPESSATAANIADEGSDAVSDPTSAATSAPRRVAPRVVIHPSLGDVAFLPEDPGMN